MHINQLKLVKAEPSMLEEINTIYLNCREELLKNGILQWDDKYPNKEFFQDCIESKCLYVLMDNGAMIGHVVLDEWQSEEWEAISWNESNPLVIHSLMLNPAVQGKGVGAGFVRLCEQLAMQRGYNSIRLDAFSGNERALRLYERLGYEKRGSVFFSSKPEGHQEYICYEKAI